jgi:hypothetical protein
MTIDLTQLITAADKASLAREAADAGARAEAEAYLAGTDWMVLRAAETGQPLTDAFRKARAAARAKLQDAPL